MNHSSVCDWIIARCSIISVVKIMTPWFPLWFILSQLHELLGEPDHVKNGTFHWIYLWNGYWIHRITIPIHQNESHIACFSNQSPYPVGEGKKPYKLPKSADHNMILVGGWATHLKNILVKLDLNSQKIGKNHKHLWNLQAWYNDLGDFFHWRSSRAGPKPSTPSCESTSRLSPNGSRVGCWGGCHWNVALYHKTMNQYGLQTRHFCWLVWMIL